MGLFDQFPYTNFHELNLMWILEALKEIQTTTEQFVAINSLKYANPIQWNITSQYEKNTIVIDPQTGTAYISVQPVPTGVALTNEDYWTVVFDLGAFVTRAAKNFTTRWEADTTLTATFNSASGEWLVWGDTLYVANVNITAGDSYVVDGNIKRITIEEVKNDILQLIANNYNAIVAMIGDLNDLTTTAKNNIVIAINELVSGLSTEAQAREDADTALQGKIDAEAQAREDADTALQGKIDAEAQARENADDALRQLILSASSYYDNIQALKEDPNAVTDKNYVVNGYYSSGDCDIMIWRTTTSATGNFGEIALDNGLYAHILKPSDNYYNIRQYGAHGDGVTDDYNIINNIITEAITHSNSVIYFPSGEYVISSYLQALRHETVQGVYVDCNGLTLCGDGINSIIHGKTNDNTFDVLQLNETANLNIKNLAITETSNAQNKWGANGISMTNGTHDIYIENVFVYDLPYYTGDGYIDGGKAFTIQTGDSATNNTYNITINNCRCKNVPFGFEYDAPASNTISFKNIRITDCVFDVLYSGASLSMPTFGTNVYGRLQDFAFIRCTFISHQHCAVVSRTSNTRFIDCTFIQNAPSQTILPSDTIVNCVMIFSSKNVIITNCLFISDFGDYAVNVTTDNVTASVLIVIKNIQVLDSFSVAAVNYSDTPSGQIYCDNILNIGAATSFTQNALASCNTVLNYGGYNVLNDKTMTKQATAKTLGSYSGKAIPMYDTLGSLVGWLPLYS